MPKTIIIFDTNVLKENNSDNIYYHTFTFNNDFKKLYDYIFKKNLFEYIKLSITDITLFELEKQRRDCFKSDNKKLGDIKKRYAYIDSKVNLFKISDDFNIKDFILDKIGNYIFENKIKILKISDDLIFQKFNDLKIRALEKNSPFNKDKKSDSGFKDALIWETILSQNFDDYENVFFITRDLGFNKNCASEFKELFNKDIFIEPIGESLFIKLDNIYPEEENLINSIEEFSNSDEFKNYINKYMYKLNIINIEDDKIKIKKYKILEYSENINISEKTGIKNIFEIISRVDVTDTDNNKMYLNIITYINNFFEIINSELKLEIL